VKVYFENCIESGRARTQLQPDQMTAVRLLMNAAKDGKFSLVTSEETYREQDQVPPPSAQNWFKQGAKFLWSPKITSSSVSITRWIASAPFQ
jgi:hypothetical protein